MDYGEERYIRFGMAHGSVLVVVHTERQSRTILYAGFEFKIRLIAGQQAPFYYLYVFSFYFYPGKMIAKPFGCH